MIYDINEIKIIKDLTISVDGETDIKYIDKNNEEVEKWITSELLVELYREKDKEIERLDNIINECANEILIELKANHHLSYGVALSIRQKLIDYKELKGDSSNE